MKYELNKWGEKEEKAGVEKTVITMRRENMNMRRRRANMNGTMKENEGENCGRKPV